MNAIRCSLVLLAAASASLAHAQLAYHVTDLGTISGAYYSTSFAEGINNSGQIIGASDSNTHVYSYANGTMTDLGNFGLSGGFDVATFRINNAGQMIVSGVNSSDNHSHAYLYDHGITTDLGTLGGLNTSAVAINDSGQIVGTTTLANGVPRGFLYANGTMSDLGVVTGNTGFTPRGINSQGNIIGVNADSTRALLYAGGSLTDLGNMGGGTLYIEGINDADQVIGYAYSTSSLSYSSFLYSNGITSPMGNFGGATTAVFGLNNSGQVVGYGETPTGSKHAFLYSSGTMYDLATDATLTGDSISFIDGAYVLRFAQDINDLGQIAAIGMTPTGSHALLLTPIPEPAIIGLFAGVSGLGVVLIFRLQRPTISGQSPSAHSRGPVLD